MRNRLLLRLLPILIFAAVLVLFGEKTPYAEAATTPSSSNGVVARDDFSGDINTLWNVLGTQVSVQSDAGGNYVELTNTGSQVGTIWLKQTVAPPYTATFQIRITPSPSSGDIADGIIFMFNKKQNLFPDNGGGMGYEVGNGYGIEFDTYLNTEDRVLCSICDPRFVHTALFKDDPRHSYSNMPLAYKQLDTAGAVTIDDGQWHSVRVDVGTDSVRMYLDNQSTPYLNYSGAIDPTYNGIGFSGSTGLYYSQQQVRDVTITKAVPLFNDAVLSPSAGVPTTGNVTVAASVYGVDPSATILKWFSGRVEDPVQLQNGGTLFTNSFQASDNGTYTIFAQNIYGGSSVQYVQVTNIDRTKPTITYNGPIDITLAAGGIFTVPTFSIADNYDTADQLQLIPTGSVDMTTPGTYSVTFQARDRAGNVSDPVALTIHILVLSSNTGLNGLTLSQGVLTPAFSLPNRNYTVDVPDTVSSLDLYLTKTDPNAMLTVTGAVYNSVTDNVYAYRALNLTMGPNPIQILVTAPNGTQNLYSISVNRIPFVIKDVNDDGVLDIGDIIAMSKQNSPSVNREIVMRWIKQISPKYVN